VPFNPLGGGVLTGKYEPSATPPAGSRFTWGEFGRNYAVRYWSAAAFGLVAIVKEIADRERLTAAQVALAWLLSRPGVTSAIVGASSPGQLRDSAAGAEASLSSEALDQLHEASDRFI